MVSDDGEQQEMLANDDDDNDMDADQTHGDEARVIDVPVLQARDSEDPAAPSATIDSDDEPLVAPPPPAPEGEGRRARMPRGTRPAPQRIVPMKKPMEPSRLQRERHEMCHLPFASWCKHCVMARSLSSQHRTKKHSDAKEVPVVSGDFCFMSREEQTGTHPVYVMRDHGTRKTFAHMVQGKSTADVEYSQYLVNAVLRDLDHPAHGKNVYETDQEPAMVALQERVRQARLQPTILETSPVEQFQSNGVVEKAVQEVEGVMRTLISALAERPNWRIPPNTPVLS